MQNRAADSGAGSRLTCGRSGPWYDGERGHRRSKASTGAKKESPGDPFFSSMSPAEPGRPVAQDSWAEGLRLLPDADVSRAALWRRRGGAFHLAHSCSVPLAAAPSALMEATPLWVQPAGRVLLELRLASNDGEEAGWSQIQSAGSGGSTRRCARMSRYY